MVVMTAMFSPGALALYCASMYNDFVLKYDFHSATTWRSDLDRRQKEQSGVEASYHM